MLLMYRRAGIKKGKRNIHISFSMPFPRHRYHPVFCVLWISFIIKPINVNCVFLSWRQVLVTWCIADRSTGKIDWGLQLAADVVQSYAMNPPLAVADSLCVDSIIIELYYWIVMWHLLQNYLLNVCVYFYKRKKNSPHVRSQKCSVSRKSKRNWVNFSTVHSQLSQNVNYWFITINLLIAHSLFFSLFW